MSRDEQQIRLPGQLTRDGLAERPPRRRQQNHPRRFPRNRFHGFKDRFGLQQHARSTAERTVIDRLMSVVGVIPQLVDLQIQQTRIPRPLDDALIQRPGEPRRKQGEHVNFHLSRSSSFSSSSSNSITRRSTMTRTTQVLSSTISTVQRIPFFALPASNN